jgi:cytosine/adenosine deaminase-related metal-dependent hydrolase
VHATHLTDTDIKILGGTQTAACFCPTTERDLADGIGPARRLADAGSSLTLGSDQQAVIDPFEELRGVEMHERLATRERDRFTPAELIMIASDAGYHSLGWSEGGRIAEEHWRTSSWFVPDSVRTTGARPDQIAYADSGRCRPGRRRRAGDRPRRAASARIHQPTAHGGSKIQLEEA